jgi:Arc/MetJ-type ribon-helix-helix transcriptional regulator
MTNTKPIKYARPLMMRVDDKFLAQIKELRELAGEYPQPTQSDVIRRAVMAYLEHRRKEMARKDRRKLEPTATIGGRQWQTLI